MRTVPPSQRQVYFAGALTAAAVAFVSPPLHPPSSAPAAALDAVMVKPSRTAEQPVLTGPQVFASYRARHRQTAPRVQVPAPRVSDDLESAAAIPSPPPLPSQAAQPASTAQASPYPSYSDLPSQSGAYGSPGAQSGSSGSTSSFQACVIARESGGNPQVMNASGHYGLYQFSASTWAAYGGNPADFGDASVAEQNQVFANAMAAGGESNWAPYDGC